MDTMMHEEITGSLYLQKAPPLAQLITSNDFSSARDDEEIDSLALLQNAPRSSDTVSLDLMSFVATFVVLIHHYQPWGCSSNFQKERLGLVAPFSRHGDCA